MNFKKSFLIFLVLIANKIYAVNDEKTIQIADSVAKVELKKISDLRPNMINEGQLSLKYYDKTIKQLLKNEENYEIIYSFNQPIAGKVLFKEFSVFVNLSTNETKFVAEDLKIYGNSKITIGWPNNIEELVNHLNKWDKEELDRYERPNLYQNIKCAGETNGWIIEHKEQLKKLEATVFWDNKNLQYKLNTK